MRILNALGIGADFGQPRRTVLMLDAVLIAAPVVAATLPAERRTEQVRP